MSCAIHAIEETSELFMNTKKAESHGKLSFPSLFL